MSLLSFERMWKFGGVEGWSVHVSEALKCTNQFCLLYVFLHVTTHSAHTCYIMLEYMGFKNPSGDRAKERIQSRQYP